MSNNTNTPKSNAKINIITSSHGLDFAFYNNYYENTSQFCNVNFSVHQENHSFTVA